MIENYIYIFSDCSLPSPLIILTIIIIPGRNPTKMRPREDSLLHAPRSLFDRPSPALIKMRQELKLQRYRGLLKPSFPTLVKPTLPVKPPAEPEHVPDWLVQEDWSILQV